MRSGLFISLFVSVLTICGINATAQEPPVLPEEIADTDKLESSAALPEYVIEVRRPEGCLVSPISSKGKSGFVLYTLPRPDKFPTSSLGRPIASKVFVSANQIGDQWNLKVSIGTGEFYDSGDMKVGDFNLSLNHRADVPDVSRFGLNSIRVGVARANRDS